MVPSLRPANSNFSPISGSNETNAVESSVVMHGFLQIIQSPAFVVHWKCTGADGNNCSNTVGVQGPQAKSSCLHGIVVFSSPPGFRVTACSSSESESLTSTSSEFGRISTPRARHCCASHLHKPLGFLIVKVSPVDLKVANLGRGEV